MHSITLSNEPRDDSKVSSPSSLAKDGFYILCCSLAARKSDCANLYSKDEFLSREVSLGEFSKLELLSSLSD